MSEAASPENLLVLRRALEAKLASNDPSEVAATLARLRRVGISDENAWRLLSAVLLQEMSLIVGEARPFDRAGYAAALLRLPELRDRK